MERWVKIALVVVLAILVIIVLYQTVQVSALGKVVSGPATGLAPSGGMVGGC